MMTTERSARERLAIRVLRSALIELHEWRARASFSDALFGDSIIVLDLGSHPQFGIINSSAR